MDEKIEGLDMHVDSCNKTDSPLPRQQLRSSNYDRACLEEKHL